RDPREDGEARARRARRGTRSGAPADAGRRGAHQLPAARARAADAEARPRRAVGAAGRVRARARRARGGRRPGRPGSRRRTDPAGPGGAPREHGRRGARPRDRARRVAAARAARTRAVRRKAGGGLTRPSEIGIAFAFLAREPLDYRHVAQWLEHHLDTVGVGGLSPPGPTRTGRRREPSAPRHTATEGGTGLALSPPWLSTRRRLADARGAQ